MRRSLKFFSDSPVSWLFCFFFCTGIFLPNGIKTLSLILFLLYLLPGLKLKEWWTGIRKDGFTLASCGFFLLTALSWFWSSNKTEYFSELQSKLPLLLVPLVITMPNQRLRTTEKPFLQALYFSGILISLACLLHATFFGKNLPLSERLVYEELACFSGIQPIYLSLYLILSSFAWYRLHFSTGFTKSGWHLLIPLFFYLMVVQLSSRTELMVYTGAVFFVAIKHFRAHLIKVAAGFAVFTLLTALLISLDKTNLSRYSEMLDFKKDYRQNNWGGRSLRLEKWKNTLECYMQFPMLGTGAGDCSDELQKIYQKNGFDIAYTARYNPHNQFLQSLLTLGPAGLLFLISMFGIAFFRARRQGDFSLFLLAYVFAASMITESMLERQTGVFLFSVLMAFFSAVPGEKVSSGNSGWYGTMQSKT